jgi:hypothetical protein
MLATETSRNGIERWGLEGNMDSFLPREWPVLNAFNTGAKILLLMFSECQGKMQGRCREDAGITPSQLCWLGTLPELAHRALNNSDNLDSCYKILTLATLGN